MSTSTVKACIRCGTDNDRYAQRCGHCGFRLPTFEIANDVPEVPVEELKTRLEDLKEACRQVLDQEVEPEDFAAFLEEKKNSLPRPHQSLVIQERGGTAQNVRRDENDDWEFAHFVRGIDAMVPFFEEFEEHFLEEGIAIIEAGNKKLIDPHVFVPVETVATLGQSTVLCVQCGTQNPIGPVNCSKCGARLPREAGGSSTDAKADLLVRFQRIKRMCEDIRRGTANPEQFGAFLESETAMLKQARDDFNASVKVGNYEQDSPEEIATVAAGFSEIEQGLDHMWAYLNEGDEVALNKGLTLARNGNLKLNNGLRLNSKTQKSLMEKQRYM
jgi:ribosomal protein L40E